ncbi:MAG: choice-of-anchor L domain-containing protein [Crocinitomicaceae bacterium]
MKQLLSVIVLLASAHFSFGQIVVDNTQTPDQLVQNVLLGFGVTATNITYNGSPVSAQQIQGNVTFFDAAGTTFPINSGVLLSTGNGIGAIGPNNSPSFTDNAPPTPNVSTDPHLNAIANAAPTNGAVLEFDFIPSGDTISFNYVFGSDEYPEFSPSTFNDAFGFFLWGPGISGPYALGGYPNGGENLAIIPGTTVPVTINNLGPGAGQYPQYYTDNQNGAAYGSAIQYDGTTVTLSANASVQCGQTYHIKLAISNVGDQAYDSGVFLQANSFASEAIQVAVATVSGDTTVIEGCSTAELQFIRPQSQIGDTLIVNYDISGTATNGTDYPLLPNPITFLPGDDTLTLTIDPLADGIPDNMEYITITTTTISVCGDTIISTGTLWIIDSVDIDVSAPDPTVYCINDSVQVVAEVLSGGEAPYTYAWNDPNNQVGDTAYLASVQSGTSGTIDYIVTATDDCGYTGTDTVTITLDQTLSIDSFFVQNANACNPTGAASAFYSGDSTNAQNGLFWNFEGPGQPGANQVNASVIVDVPSGWYYVTLTDAVCTVEDSVFIDIDEPPVAQFTPPGANGCSPVNLSFVNSSQNTVNYSWDFGDGSPIDNATDPSHTFTQSATVTLIASDASGCADTAYAQVVVVPCGCTDPTASNYDPNAMQDDGSCIYPQPEVTAPNIFTPDNDNINDIFSLDSKNTTNIKLTITNRWGNLMYEGEGPNPAWDGTNQGGKPAEDGVYFYLYQATGVEGNVIEGHGFVHVERK